MVARRRRRPAAAGGAGHPPPRPARRLRPGAGLRRGPAGRTTARPPPRSRTTAGSWRPVSCSARPLPARRLGAAPRARRASSWRSSSPAAPGCRSSSTSSRGRSGGRCSSRWSLYAVAGLGPRVAWSAAPAAAVVLLVLRRCFHVARQRLGAARCVVVGVILDAGAAGRAGHADHPHHRPGRRRRGRVPRPLAPLGRRVDPERVGLLLALGIRAVPVVAGLAAEVRDAQRARGLRLDARARSPCPSSSARCGTPTRWARRCVARGVDD